MIKLFVLSMSTLFSIHWLMKIYTFNDIVLTNKQVFHILHAILWLKVMTGNYSGRLENRKKLMVGKIGYQLFID